MEIPVTDGFPSVLMKCDFWHEQVALPVRAQLAWMTAAGATTKRNPAYMYLKRSPHVYVQKKPTGYVHQEWVGVVGVVPG